MKIYIYSLLIITIFVLSCNNKNSEQKNLKTKSTLFINQNTLEKNLSQCHSKNSSNSSWPRKVSYIYTTMNWKSGVSKRQKKSILIQKKPKKIIAHSVGVTEILWAIIPKKRFAGFHKTCTDKNYSLLSKEIKATGKIFSARETEKVIGWNPDIVFTVSYSNAAFKKSLEIAKIQNIDLGYFARVKELKELIFFLGKCVGEEKNAQTLVQKINFYSSKLQSHIGNRKKYQYFHSHHSLLLMEKIQHSTHFVILQD